MTTNQILTGIRDWVLDKLGGITDLIPSQASSQNQLADKAYVNSSVATATATFRGTYNVVTDLELPYTATHAQIAYALGEKLEDLGIAADSNDYAYAQVPNSYDKPTEIARIEKYKFNGLEWGYEYELNNSGFTASQWDAINSGATLELIGKLSALPTNTELTAALSSKAARAESPTAGHLASLDAGGSLTDSGINIKDNGAYDVSAHNSNASFAGISALLSRDDLSTLIPEAVRHGGMSIKFVLSGSNKYTQYRLRSREWSTSPADWQSEDDENAVIPQTGTEVAVKPNVLNVWGSVSALDISFTGAESGKINEYMLQFTVQGDSFTLGLPAGVRWTEEPDFINGNTYQVSIVDNLAVGAGWEAASE